MPAAGAGVVLERVTHVNGLIGAGGRQLKGVLEDPGSGLALPRSPT